MIAINSVRGYFPVISDDARKFLSNGSLVTFGSIQCVNLLKSSTVVLFTDIGKIAYSFEVSDNITVIETAYNYKTKKIIIRDVKKFECNDDKTLDSLNKIKVYLLKLIAKNRLAQVAFEYEFSGLKDEDCHAEKFDNCYDEEFETNDS